MPPSDQTSARKPDAGRRRAGPSGQPRRPRRGGRHCSASTTSSRDRRQRRPSASDARSLASRTGSAHQGNVSTVVARRLRAVRRTRTLRRRSRRDHDCAARASEFLTTCARSEAMTIWRRRTMKSNPDRRGGGCCCDRDTRRADTIKINGGGRDVPEPDLLEVVLRVQQAAPERRDQLPVDRLRRRHPADHEPDGVLRRHRRADDATSSSWRRRARSFTSRPCSARTCRSTTFPA